MNILLAVLALAAADAGAGGQAVEAPAQQVTVDNFRRAETDYYFAGFARDGALGRFVHSRELADVAHQAVVRMNRDTIYSTALFDLDAGPVTVTLPDAGGRFLSLMTINEDHYNTVPTIYAPGPHVFTRDQVGTRYVALLVRTFVDPSDPADLAAAHALQDAIRVEQPGGPGRFEAPAWDQASLERVRNGLKSLGGLSTSRMFGTPEQVDPVQHLIGTAAGWGGNPLADARYIGVMPVRNDGTTVHRLRVRDVPVDGFWSISVYNEAGFFAPNPRNAYSLNNVTAARDADGGYTIQFGGCEGAVRNCLPIVPGWNYLVRLYRPRPEISEGRWTFPEAQPVE
ncbi:MAG: DUF1254 domain-containing protein [Allosphingosinicella sp.]